MMCRVGTDRPERRGAVTLRDVAAMAGVHPATASRALNAETRELVNGDTADRVLAAAQELGYRPNPIARGLKTDRSYTIGVVVPDLRNPIFPPLARGIEDRLERNGYTSLLANTDNDPERERLSFDALRARKVDGFITATARREHPLLYELAGSGMPLVLVNRSTDGDELPSAVADDENGIGQAVEHLADLGHRRIGHFAVRSISTGERRYQGFLAAMEGRGLQVDPALVVETGMYSEEQGARATRQLLERRATFTAIVAGNDLMALGAIDALREAGLDCPGDVSVVGVNDMAWSDRFSPALTTVRMPHYELGVTAADLLLERLASPQAPPRHVMLPAQLVVRASTARPLATAATTLDSTSA
jgi:LacI family transcriptional regulator